MIDYQVIKKILPQAYPFILIDRIIDFKKGESLFAIKNITGNEWIYDRGDRDNHIFPETLLIEAAAQAALVLYGLSKVGGRIDIRQFMLGKVTAEFRNTILIGECLELNTLATKMLKMFGYMDIELFMKEKKIGDVRLIYKIST